MFIGGRHQRFLRIPALTDVGTDANQTAAFDGTALHGDVSAIRQLAFVGRKQELPGQGQSFPHRGLHIVVTHGLACHIVAGEIFEFATDNGQRLRIVADGKVRLVPGDQPQLLVKGGNADRHAVEHPPQQPVSVPQRRRVCGDQGYPFVLLAAHRLFAIQRRLLRRIEGAAQFGQWPANRQPRRNDGRQGPATEDGQQQPAVFDEPLPCPRLNRLDRQGDIKQTDTLPAIG